MDVRIGVTYTAKEIEVDLGTEADGDALEKEIGAVLSKGEGVLWLTDRKGRKVAIPASKIAYVEIGTAGGDRRIGFVG